MVDTFTFTGLIIFQLTFAPSSGHNSTRTGQDQLLLITVCPALAQRCSLRLIEARMNK